MKGILKYTVTKEIEIDFDENTFKTTENINSFWENLLKAENGIKIKGIYIKDKESGKKIFK